VQEIYNTPGANLTITYSDVEGGSSSVSGNINRDPLFLDAGNGNLGLQSDSPCIDSGTSQGAPTDDIEGFPRPAGGGYDMGAYEYEYEKETCQGNPAPEFSLGFGDHRIYVTLKALEATSVGSYDIFYTTTYDDINKNPPDSDCSVESETEFSTGEESTYILENNIENKEYYVRVRAGQSGCLSDIKSVTAQKTVSLTGGKGDSGACSALPPYLNPNPWGAFVLWLAWGIAVVILRKRLKRLREVK
jgi:hypothetical protein